MQVVPPDVLLWDFEQVTQLCVWPLDSSLCTPHLSDLVEDLDSACVMLRVLGAAARMQGALSTHSALITVVSPVAWVRLSSPGLAHV